MSVPSITINKVCLSGLNAIAMADQLIRAGEVEIVVAGGMESMTNAPHLLPKSREGFKYGDTTLVDSMAYDALFDQVTQQAMGLLTEEINGAAQNLTREEQDEFSARSHQRAAEAWKNGLFDDEVVPVAVPQRRGDPVMVTTDEGVRGDTTAESLSKLRPAFSKDGTITAGSSSQISDGAAAVVVMSKAKAEELGLEWLAEIGAHGMVAGPDSSLQLPAGQRHRAGLPEGGHQPRRPRPRRVQRGVRRGRHRRRPASSASPDEKVNVNGGAIALGHPVGMSGTRVVLHPGPRAQAPRRRRRRGRPVRWRRPGRRPDRACPVAGPTSRSTTSSRAPGPVRPGRWRGWSRWSRTARRSCAR